MSYKVACAQTLNVDSISLSKIFYNYSNRQHWCLPNQLVNHVLQWLLFLKIFIRKWKLKLKKVQIPESESHESESKWNSCFDVKASHNLELLWNDLQVELLNSVDWHTTIQGGFFCPNSHHSLWQFSVIGKTNFIQQRRNV